MLYQCSLKKKHWKIDESKLAKQRWPKRIKAEEHTNKRKQGQHIGTNRGIAELRVKKERTQLRGIRAATKLQIFFFNVTLVLRTLCASV